MQRAGLACLHGNTVHRNCYHHCSKRNSESQRGDGTCLSICGWQGKWGRKLARREERHSCASNSSLCAWHHDRVLIATSLVLVSTPAKEHCSEMSCEPWHVWDWPRLWWIGRHQLPLPLPRKRGKESMEFLTPISTHGSQSPWQPIQSLWILYGWFN